MDCHLQNQEMTKLSTSSLTNFHYYYLLETVFIYNEYIEFLNHNDVIMKGIMQAKDCRLPILLP